MILLAKPDIEKYSLITILVMSVTRMTLFWSLVYTVVIASQNIGDECI